MRFDFLSFLIGVILTAIIGFILFRLRGGILRVQQTVTQGAKTTRRFLSTSREGRYYEFVVRTLNAYHLAGDVVKLSDVYVEPRFLHPLPPADPTEERSPSVFRVVPQIHDLPASYAPYNVESLGVHDLRIGERHLAILGPAGAGKSSTLAIIGLVAAGEIELPAIDVMVDEVFEDEIRNLPPDEREKRIRSRRELQERALTQLRTMREQKHERAEARPASDLGALLPILVHLNDIDLRPESYGMPDDASKAARMPQARLDPAEPLVAALQRRASGVNATTLPRLVYDRLNKGTALVLIDGFDDIAPRLRPAKLAWLRQFLEMYQANYILVAGPETGFDALLNIGLQPLFVRAWGDGDYEALVTRWAEAWPVISGQRGKGSLPDEKVMLRVITNVRGRSPLDVTLKTWMMYADDEQQVGRAGWYDFLVRRHIGADQPDVRALLHKAGAALLDQENAPLTRDQIKALAASSASKADDVMNRALRCGLLVEWPGAVFTGLHSLVAAFLAAEGLPDDQVAAVAEKPGWSPAMPFVAARLPIDAVVNARLNAPPDLAYANLFDMAGWLVDAPLDAPWRGEVFKRLGGALGGPSQFPRIRERAMAALVTSRDKGVLFIFRQALMHNSPLVRRLGCIGLGAYGDTDAVGDLSNALKDSDPDVQLAAGLALAALGTEKALDEMMQCLFEGEQSLRRAVSEALAGIPGIGHATLREAIGNQEDMMMRYAAVFGLARIKASWSLATLYRTLLEDQEWYVRNAAEQAFREIEDPELGGVTKRPEADALHWLITWAANRGEGVPAGPNARQMLIRALQEGEPELRSVAARTLADMGHVQALKPLYSALRDRDENVRGAVHESLASLQARLGTPLPLVS